MNATSNNLAIVLQKECVISNTQRIATGGFGPCYILTVYDPQTHYSALAHIDDTTQVATISKIFETIVAKGARKDNLKVGLMGGWAEFPESANWGSKINQLLEQEGITEVDLRYYHTKPTPAEGLQVRDTLEGRAEEMKYKFPGGILDPKTGLFQFFAKPWKKIELMEHKNNQVYVNSICTKVREYINMGGTNPEQYAIDLANKEYPLTIRLM